MTYSWLMAPHECEPDYDAYWRDLESLETAMSNVATYDDWFPDLLHAVDGAVLSEFARPAQRVSAGPR